MKTFTDILGDEWKITFNIGEMRRMEERIKETGLGVEITSPESVILRLQDIFFLADFLYLTVEEEANTRNVSSKEFGYRLAGDVIEQARNALVEEYADFFQNESQREKIRALANSVGKIGMEILTQSIAKKETAMSEIKVKVLEEMERLTDKAVSAVGSRNSAVSAGMESGTNTSNG